ncbi:hypothetical protein [Alkalibacillus haloalkaliphilus]|uniref:hypothetical protein n=1 Tax=Alkalibacillus haloalkaliphilus TaxID=94136 RepID=UPI0002F3191F|nr:hypothetical protein [Alkalibacillus haloalkaliphilus]
MKKVILLVMLIFSMLCGLNIDAASANSIHEVRPLEETYPEYGYKTVEEAVNEFEQHFNQSIKLPLRIPPIKFTHHFGRFNDLDGDINDSFELIYINSQSPENQYEIAVRPLEHKIPIEDKRVVEVFTLKNGNEAKLINISDSFEALVFERDHWQYKLSINKKISDKVSSEMLVEIANSIDYPSEKKK